MPTKVAIFIDGKSFYSGWRDTANPTKINFSRMASWLANQVNADQISGAFYYTGIETDGVKKVQRKLLNFLDSLQHESGFTVRKFPKKVKKFTCSGCNKEHIFLQERDTETSLVSDMLEIVAKKKADSVILISGNSTFTSAVTVAKDLGVKVFLASWDDIGVSQRLSSLTSGTINLMDGLRSFELVFDQEPKSGDQEEYEEVEEDEETILANNNALLEELRKAEKKFSGGYVGLNYFINRWASSQLDNDPTYRKDIIDDLIVDGSVEVYKAPDGKEAIRSKTNNKSSVVPGNGTEVRI